MAEPIAPTPAHFPPPSSSPTPSPPPPPASIVWLNGPRAVGKSTIGYHLFTRLNRTVAKSAYVDLAQISFCHPTPADDPHHHRLKATTLAAMWQNFRTAGAHHLIVTGTIAAAEHLLTYRAALGPSHFALVRLDATAAALTTRLAARATGSGPAIPGDDLRGCTSAELRVATELALHEAASLQASAIDDQALDTTDLSAAEAADALFQTLYVAPR